VVPELLDHLDPDDPAARRSRRDLQRIHLVMGTLHTLRAAIGHLGLEHPPRHILELGAGDGTLLLRLARSQAAAWPGVELTLLDKHDLVSARTREAYAALGWRVSVLKADILDWARAPSPRYDLCVTSLFLHHFAGRELADILVAVAARSAAFVACEPRRDRWSGLASRLVGVMGGNRVTRSDAVSSVAAGFADVELSQAWPDGAAWVLDETRSLPFTHCFSARARLASAGVDA
jgi:SAM-dependent methyltransferase